MYFLLPDSYVHILKAKDSKIVQKKPSEYEVQGRFVKGIKMGGYFAANSNVFVAVLDAFDFEVIVMVATHSTPGAKPVTVTGLLDAEEDKFELKTTVLSNFFFTDTSMVTPSFGKVEEIVGFISNDVPTTA